MFKISEQKILKLLSCFLALLVLVGSFTINFPINAKAEDVQLMTIKASEDTFAYRDVNNAISTNLVCRYNGSGGYERISYIKFDLSNLAGVNNLSSSKLKIYLRNHTGSPTNTTKDGAVGVYGLYDDNWSDDTVHEKNPDNTYKRPSEEGKLLIGTYSFSNEVEVDVTVNAWQEYDIKDFIEQRLQAGATTATVMLQNLSPADAKALGLSEVGYGQGYANYASSEYAVGDAKFEPNLVIEYLPPVPPSEPIKKVILELAEEPTPLSVKFKWPVVENAVQYSVSRTVYGEDMFTVVSGLINTVSETVYFEDITVQNNQTYLYKVKAIAVDDTFSESDTLKVIVPILILQKPVNLVLSEVTGSKVSFSWSEVQNSTAYSVYRSVNDNVDYSFIDSTSLTSYTDNNVYENTTYHYKVQAARNGIMSEMSDMLTVTTIKIPGPGDSQTKAFIPTDDAYINQASGSDYKNFGASKSMLVRYNGGAWKRISYVMFDMGDMVGVTTTQQAKLRLYLDQVMSGGSMVDVYALNDTTWDEMEITANNLPNESERELIGSINAVSSTPLNGWYEIDITEFINSRFDNYERELSIMLSGRSNSGGYAYFSSKEGYNAPEVVIDYIIPQVIPPLEKPVASVEELTGTNVKINWPVAAGAAKYKVYKRIKGEQEFSNVVGSMYTLEGSKHLNDTNVEFGTEYEYKVDAVGPDNKVLSSDLLTLKTPDLNLEAPTVLNVNLNMGDGLSLSWNSVQFAVYYELFRSLNKDGGFVSLGEISETSFIDMGLQLDTTYFYRIKAKRNQYESPLSEISTFVTEKSTTKILGNIKNESSSSNNGILVKLMDESGVTKSTFTDTNGNFVIYAVPNGNYTIEYSKVGYLKNLNKDVSINGQDIDLGDQGELKWGDLNGDGFIDIRDLRLIAAAYGNVSTTVDFSPLLDLNKDNKIDQADLDILMKNYLLSAE